MWMLMHMHCFKSLVFLFPLY